MKIILGSGSARRKELLSLITSNFEILVSNADETLENGLSLEEQVEKLSYIKAKSVYDITAGDRIVIGADTIVVKNGKIYGKPKNKEDAKNIIKELLKGDKSNDVITGLTVLIKNGDNYIEHTTFEKTRVYFTSITDFEIEKWIASGNAMDKAGAYAVQGEFGVFIDKIEGNYSSVVGLPIHKLYEFIKEYIN